MAEIKNLKKAANRILKAIKQKQRIIIYGDADLDGVGSVIILKETIRNLGGSIFDIYFPDREQQGYGLNMEALNYLKKEAPALLLVLDCGIGNFKEVALAKKIGFEVIIIDHHQILDKLPQASIICNPHQKGDRYPFKEFATAGIVFKLAQLLLKDKLTLSLKNNFLELVALSTLADLMPQVSENLEFVEQGLASLKTSFRPGLKVFWQIDQVKNLAKDNIRQLAQKIISACHAGGRQDHLNEGYLLLTSTSNQEAETLAKDLLEKAYLRHQEIKSTIQEIETRILKKIENPIIFEGAKAWKILILGPAASRICHDYKKPVFLYSQREKDSQGAVRTPSEIDSVEAMGHCSRFLVIYGGHPQAAGFRIKNENLEMFKQCLIGYFESKKR